LNTAISSVSGEWPRDIVDQAYRHYTTRIGKLPGSTLDNDAALGGSDSMQDRVSDQAGMCGEATPILHVSLTN
jgi:hypothetical protein